MTNEFEKGTPAEKSPAEKTPEEIKQERKDIFANIVLNAMNEGVSTEEINELGKKIINKLDDDTFTAEVLVTCEKAGIEGLRVLAGIAEAKSATLKAERDLELLQAEQKAFEQKNGDISVDTQPKPEQSAFDSEKRIGEVGKDSTK